MRKLIRWHNQYCFVFLRVSLAVVLGLCVTSRGYCQNESVANEPALALSLEEVTELALHNSLDIQIAQFDTYIARTSLTAAESLFDTFFSANATFLRDRHEQSSIILGTESKQHSFSAGLSKKFPTGTTLGIEGTGLKQRSNSSFSAFNPYNEALVTISLKQELGKNFFGLADRADIRITKLDIENSEFTSLDDIETALFDIQKAYWTLVLRKEQITIAQLMLQKAQQLYGAYIDKYDLGLVEQSELLAVEALVKARESSLLVAQLASATAKNNLLFLLNHAAFNYTVEPKDSLEIETRPFDLYEEVDEAVRWRRDYKAIENDLERNDIDIVKKKNALWPEIDLEATFSRNNLDGERSNSWKDIPGENSDEIFVGLTITYPLENRAAKANLEAARLLKEQLILRFKRIERKVLQELNDNVNGLNVLSERVALYRQTTEIHRKKLDQQIKRLGSGRSDVDTLIRYQEDLFQAELLLAQALFEYRVSLIGLELSKNTLLGHYWKEPL